MLQHLKFDEVRAKSIILLDLEIENAVSGLLKAANSSERTAHLDYIDQLVKTRNELKHQGKIMKGVDPTVLVSGLIGIVGVLLMLNFERDDIISTKALPSIGKWFGM